MAAGVAGVGGGDLPVAPSSVAEKNSVWRSSGVWATIRLDGRLEAHVEHAVGLVEDEDVDLAERDDAAGDQVLEPAGGGDEDVGAAGGLICGPKPTPP